MTLFSYQELTIKRFKDDYNLEISPEFLNCADIQLTKEFTLKSGLKFGKNICLSWSSKDSFIYQLGKVSKLSFNLYVNHNWNELIITWKSKSGKIYQINDLTIDCNDIVFSFDKLDVELFKSQLYPKIKIPIEFSKFSFRLIPTRINQRAIFLLKLKNNNKHKINAIIDEIMNFINSYNNGSEIKKRKNGIIHSSKIIAIKECNITLDIDMGSTGLQFLEKFLNFLSKLDEFISIEII